MKYLKILKQEGIKPVQILFISVIGGMAFRIAYLPVFHDTLFFTWLNYVPFFCLGALTIVYSFLNSRLYIQTKNLLAFLPVVIGLICVFVIIMQNKKRESWDQAATIFTARTNQIGSDGGLTLDFKSDGILKVTKMDHWAVTYYWGRYELRRDTVDLDIALDFKLGRKGVVGKDTLRFLGDTVRFEVYRFE